MPSSTMRRFLFCLLMMINSLALLSRAQTLTGTSLADPAMPTLISPASQGSDIFVLNKDLSLSGRFRSATTQGIVCPAPAGFSAASSAPRTLLNDGNAAYFTAQSSGASAAASTSEPAYPCHTAAALALGGGNQTQAFSTNDTRHGKYFVLSAFGGNGPDTLTVMSNLNTNNGPTPTLTQLSTTNLDTGGTYTSMVTDVNSNYGLTAITQLRTATSTGGLWVYSPGIQTSFKILGPGGKPLPAIGAFIIPAMANDNGDLLVLVNQDNLTASNLASPPAVTTPFTIIDLGQLQRAFSAVVSQGTTVTLPFVTQIAATTPYYAMLGATYSPVFHVLYALTAGGTLTNVVENVIRYDVTNPSASAETVVADVSNIPYTSGSYPQLALNAAAGTMEILSAATNTLYHVGVAGKNNIATVVTGTPFGDSNFKPTYVVANQLLGETYISSASQIDILTRSGTTLPRGTIELYGTDNAVVNQGYTLYASGFNPNYDNDLSFANVTFTATPSGGGAPFTLGMAPFYNFTGGPGTSTPVTFPAVGIYSVVASVPATTNYPAITSLPITVGVGSNGVAPVYPTTLKLNVPASSASTTVTGTLTLSGSTYAPSGRIIIFDAANSQVGRFNFTGGAQSYPANVTLTLPVGNAVLTAIYSGDTQNQGSTSSTASITVGAATVATTTTITAPATATAATPFVVTVRLANSASTSTPAGNVNVTATPSGGSASTVGSASAAQALASGGYGVQVTLPTAGTYQLTVTYAGDTNFSASNASTSVTVTAAPPTAINLSVSAASTVTGGVAFPATVTFIPRTTSTVMPTGNVVLTTYPAGSTTPSVTLNVLAKDAFASGGSAVQLTLNTVGTYTLTVTYAGDSTYAAATSSIGIAVASPARTTPAYGLSLPATANVGDRIPVSVSYTFAGTVIPTGDATLYFKGRNGTITPAGVIPASNARNSLVTVFTITAPASDVYSAYISYPGDASFNAATSDVSTITIYGTAPTFTKLTVSGPSLVQPNTNFNVTVALIPSAVLKTAPTDFVLLNAYNKLSIYPPTLIARVPAAQAAAAGGIVVTGSIPDQGLGAWQIDASYVGDANYSAPSTVSYGFTEFQKSTLRITVPSVAYINTAASVTLYLTCGGNTPSNKVFISSSLNGTAGPSANVTAAEGTSLASLTFPTVGTWVLTATYAGDSQTSSAIAPTVNLVVSPPLVGPQFTLTPDDPTMGIPGRAFTVEPNSTRDAPFTLTATNGYNTAVMLTFKRSGSTSSTLSLVDSSGNAITSLTPVAAGTHFFLRISDPQHTVSNTVPSLPGTRTSKVLLCGLLGAMLFGWRNNRAALRLRKALVLCGIVLVIAGAGTVLGGCAAASSDIFPVEITATPVNNTQGASPQVVTFYVDTVQ